ncbi:hypothetical protein [Asticcacaulis excentricus]|uniref:Uncharacterized protein n=1 Tax=Asticcacaulis excentricus TaxID=78587 RepID=A0A3G9FZT0_9CAUL|nr:hypothetical protein [Asticcacaulis excentricus]BBF79897.1 hypothetical protein EM6_0474 [Asticcacaulis excentricus]
MNLFEIRTERLARRQRTILARTVNQHLRLVGAEPVNPTRKPRRSELFKFIADVAALNGWSVSYVQTKRKKLEAEGKIPKPDKLNPPRWYPQTLDRFYAQPAAEPAPPPKLITPRPPKPAAVHLPAAKLSNLMNRSV